MLNRLLYILYLSVFLSGISDARTLPDKDEEVIFLKIEIIDDDTLYIYDMDEFIYDEKQGLISRLRSRSFTRLMMDIEKTMPYAQLAAQTLYEIDSTLMTLDTERARKVYLDSAEKKLMNEFESELRNLNRRQGLLLIKLIDRETGNTTYHLLREYRSRWSAFFWQGIARVFGMNLRTEYDASNEEDIEDAIKRLGFE